ncbi:hypothetical protein [Dinghuibacter silviterrae]|uniref:Uncharacterized protein n=1 Tax=Dinghuibacter silviterrae TaxID=1539049 RepID=A0A4R8DTF3_9BACT|nr:hypothetical protein [Dinghuibacter silviterrae]TDX01560.1 hypothetical protein EDB95_2600 [Dinghuibacter silviterrae]
MKALAIILIVVGILFCWVGVYGFFHVSVDTSKGTAYTMGQYMGHFVFPGLGVLFLILGIRMERKK